MCGRCMFFVCMHYSYIWPRVLWVDGEVKSPKLLVSFTKTHRSNTRWCSIHAEWCKLRTRPQQQTLVYLQGVILVCYWSFMMYAVLFYCSNLKEKSQQDVTYCICRHKVLCGSWSVDWSHQVWMMSKTRHKLKRLMSYEMQILVQTAETRLVSLNYLFFISVLS